MSSGDFQSVYRNFYSCSCKTVALIGIKLIFHKAFFTLISGRCMRYLWFHFLVLCCNIHYLFMPRHYLTSFHLLSAPPPHMFYELFNPSFFPLFRNRNWIMASGTKQKQNTNFVFISSVSRDIFLTRILFIKTFFNIEN